jgi:hypothetical protein
MLCAICQKRRPRRSCPGVRGDICPVCCGTEREVTVRCPSDCEYLMEARKHERTEGLDPASIPHRDITISEDFLERNTGLISELSGALTGEASRNGAVDSDAREALAGLIQTYRTLQSGVIYESLPANPLAAGLHRAMQAAATQFLTEERRALGMAKTRDADILRALVFLHVFSIDRNNGRKYARSFLDALLRFQPADASAGREESGSSLILP